MQTRSVASTLFSARELRRLQTLYRSRELAQLMRASKNKINAASSSTNYVYTIYGARGGLSPNQRTIFRTHLSRFDGFKDVFVKFSLFPTAVSQSVMAFSHLREVRSLLKGSSYRMSIELQGEQDTSFTNEGHNLILSKLPLFINHLQAVRFTEESTRQFEPSLFFIPTESGASVPRRFEQLKEHPLWGLSKKDLFHFQAAQLN